MNEKRDEILSTPEAIDEARMVALGAAEKELDHAMAFAVFALNKAGTVASVIFWPEELVPDLVDHVNERLHDYGSGGSSGEVVH